MDGKLKLNNDQFSKLYLVIEKGVSAIQERKAKKRMRLNAFEFQRFFQHALNHFCVHIEKPFNFAQVYFFKVPSCTSLSQNVLAVAVSMIGVFTKPNVPQIFETLSPFIASCIMLDAVRLNIKGK
jgi:hypothetical protein